MHVNRYTHDVRAMSAETFEKLFGEKQQIKKVKTKKNDTLKITYETKKAVRISKTVFEERVQSKDFVIRLHDTLQFLTKQNQSLFSMIGDFFRDFCGQGSAKAPSQPAKNDKEQSGEAQIEEAIRRSKPSMKKDVTEHQAYFGEITQEDAKAILKDKKNGSWIVYRDSTEGDLIYQKFGSKYKAYIIEDGDVEKKLQTIPGIDRAKMVAKFKEMDAPKKVVEEKLEEEFAVSNIALHPAYWGKIKIYGEICELLSKEEEDAWLVYSDSLDVNHILYKSEKKMTRVEITEKNIEVALRKLAIKLDPAKMVKFDEKKADLYLTTRLS